MNRLFVHLRICFFKKIKENTEENVMRYRAGMIPESMVCQNIYEALNLGIVMNTTEARL